MIDPEGSQTGKARIIKGGCWIVEAKYCRPARRSRINPNHKSNTVGFRLVKEYHKIEEDKWEPHSEETKKVIQEAGFQAAYLAISNPPNPNDHYTLPRYGAHSDLWDFRWKLCGADWLFSKYRNT